MTTTRFRAGLLATAALLFTVAAEAALPPPVQISVNGGPLGSVSWAVDTVNPAAFVTAQTFLSGNDVNIGESLLEPTINPAGTGWSFSYGLGFNVTGTAASTLKVVYDIPFGPNYLPTLSQPLLVTSSLIGTLVDGTGNGVQIIAPSSTYVQTVSFQIGYGNNAGVSVGPSFTGAASSASGESYTYGSYLASNSLTSGSLSGMTVVAEFTLQPGMSALALDGTVTVTPVPEPGSYAMFAAGLGLMGLIARRRRFS